MAKTKIHGEYLDPSVISTQTEVTAVGSDHMLIFDATDNALKKALLSDLIETVGSTPTFSQISSTGNLTIDAAGDIILDADGDDWKFHEGGNAVFEIKHESHGVDFMLNTTDEDWRFKGSDGGSTITALHLDMSERGNATFFGNVLAYGNSDTVAALEIYSDSNHGMRILHRATDGDFSFERRVGGTNTEFLRIGRSTGNIGIGDTSPVAKLTVKAASDTIRAESLATDAKNITMTYNDSNDRGEIISTQDGVADKDFLIRGANLLFQRSGGTEAWRINSSGHFTPAQQHTVDIGGTNAEVRNVYAQGISFASNAHASGMSSELLDDYEEGSWTPRISSSTGTAMSGASATYTKVGRLVTVRFDITNNTGSNTTQIFGLPFDSSGHGGINIVWNDMSNEHYTGGYTSTGVIVLVKGGTASSWSFTNGNRILGFGTYFTN